jgi:hypothetical protein
MQQKVIASRKKLLSHLLSSSPLGALMIAAGANTASGAARSLNASDSLGETVLLLLSA